MKYRDIDVSFTDSAVSFRYHGVNGMIIKCKWKHYDKETLTIFGVNDQGLFRAVTTCNIKK